MKLALNNSFSIEMFLRKNKKLAQSLGLTLYKHRSKKCPHKLLRLVNPCSTIREECLEVLQWAKKYPNNAETLFMKLYKEWK